MDGMVMNFLVEVKKYIFSRAMKCIFKDDLYLHAYLIRTSMIFKKKLRILFCILVQISLIIDNFVNEEKNMTHCASRYLVDE
jgi:hypothetical protein